ncbi:uncharacterized protein [Solanum lycopersicum]|uniref:uncharacterized protein n=1 Tax=Solanum lycopersicum TaxID=4081 RepID=UPI0002BC8CE1
MKCKVVDMNQQLFTLEVTHENSSELFNITYVYAKCKEHLRRPLWDRLLHWSDIEIPWCIIGDFNVIYSSQEKLGGREYNISKSVDFISTMEHCGLVDLGYNGQPFTWCNHRKNDARIWKRLDRGLANDKWLDKMPHTIITHLSAVGSDHCPLLMEMKDRKDDVIKYFKFLNCWTENDSFYQIVEKCWNEKVVGNPMWILHTKMKRLTITLRNWSKKEYGDVFIKTKEFEEMVKRAEENILQNNNQENRERLQAVNAQYIRYMKLEQNILQQKSQIHWLTEGNTNSKYFHAIIRGRIKKMCINKIESEEGEWIKGDVNIAKEVCDYYGKMFTGN